MIFFSGLVSDQGLVTAGDWFISYSILQAPHSDISTLSYDQDTEDALSLMFTDKLQKEH